MPLHLRPYRADDWAQLCRIHDAARRVELQSAGLAAAFLTLEQTAEGEGLFDGEVCVAASDTAVHGFVAFTAGELTWLYVDPALARRGIGRQLLRHAVQACSGGSLTTEVLLGNEPALALYVSEGFEVLRQVDGRLAGNEAFAARGYVLRRCA